MSDNKATSKEARIIKGTYRSSMKISFLSLIIVSILEVFIIVFSFLHACYDDESGKSIKELAHIADERMYAAKSRYYRESGKERRM